MEIKTMKKKKIDIGNPRSIHPSIKKSTVEKLMKVLRYFAEETRRLNMRDWGRFYTPIETGFHTMEEPESFPPCGTSGCLAGGVLLTTKEGMNILKKNNCFIFKRNKIHTIFPFNTNEEAAQILGINSSLANNLFYFKGMAGGNKIGWPIEFEKAYERATTADGRFEATKARVFHFIETGK